MTRLRRLKSPSTTLPNSYKLSHLNAHKYTTKTDTYSITQRKLTYTVTPLAQVRRHRAAPHSKSITSKNSAPTDRNRNRDGTGRRGRGPPPPQLPKVTLTGHTTCITFFAEQINAQPTRTTFHIHMKLDSFNQITITETFTIAKQ